MDSNLAVFAVLTVYWLVADRRLGLCLVVLLYYAAFIATELTDLQGYFKSDVDTTLGTYLVQMSVDSIALVAVAGLSLFYQKNIKIFVAYGAIIATSLLLNGLMLYDQVLDLSVIYHIHAIRQEFSIPLDVLFAVLGSVRDDRQGSLDNLRTRYRSIYNRAIDNSQTLDD